MLGQVRGRCAGTAAQEVLQHRGICSHLAEAAPMGIKALTRVHAQCWQQYVLQILMHCNHHSDGTAQGRLSLRRRKCQCASY